MGEHNGGVYTSLSAMLIESAALFSLWGLVYLVAYARKYDGLHNILISAFGIIQVSQHSPFIKILN